MRTLFPSSSLSVNILGPELLLENKREVKCCEEKFLRTQVLLSCILAIQCAYLEMGIFMNVFPLYSLPLPTTVSFHSAICAPFSPLPTANTHAEALVSYLVFLKNISDHVTVKIKVFLWNRSKSRVPDLTFYFPLKVQN